MAKLLSNRTERDKPVIIKFLLLIIFIISGGISNPVFSQFNPGKLAVLVVGNGSVIASGAAAPVFVKEFNLTGASQAGTIRTTLPTTAVGGTTAVNRALTQSFAATAEGFLNLSSNGQYLTLAGYNVSSGTANVSSTVSTTFPTNSRIIGKIGVNGVPDTKTTLFTSYSGIAVRSVATVNGTAYWTAGASAAGINYTTDGNVAAITNLNTTNTRGIGIFNNQLYSSAQSGTIRLATVGSGLPISGAQTLSNLSGFTTSTGDPYSFIFLNLDGTAGPDVVYVASLNVSPTGIIKYTSANQGSTWTAKGTLTGFGFGVTAVYNSCTGNVDLYITSSTSGTVKPTFLYKFIDNSAATSTLSAAITSGSLLATAATNTAFGGVAFTPGTTLTAPTAFTVTGGNGCTNTGVIIGLSSSETGVSYQLFNGANPVGSAITGSGTAISFGNQTAAGTYTVTATSLLSTCTTTMSGSVVINVFPTVSFTGLPVSKCLDASAVTLTGNRAPGGIFTGSGITNNGNGTAIFNPATAGAGTYDITYSYTDINACSNSSSQTITVINLPATPVISGTLCAGTTLTVSPTNDVASLVWKMNGSPISTVTATGPATIGKTAAGGNGLGSGPNQFNFPQGIFVDGTGNIYVSDLNNDRVQRWAPGATYGTTVAGGNGPGPAANQLHNPAGVFVGPAGNIFISDMLINERIQRWAPGASSGVTVAGGNGFGSGNNQFHFPVDIQLPRNSEFYLYISDMVNNRVQFQLTSATSGFTVAGGNGPGSGTNQLNAPQGIFVDATGGTFGNIYIADRNNNRIQRWPPPPATSGVTIAGGNGPGSGANQLDNPTGVYLDGNGNIYVADYNNHRIQRWAPGATSGVTVAGGNGQGAGANQLNHPVRVFVSGNGVIYISDESNNRIQQWEPTITNNSLPNAAAGNYTVTLTGFSGCSSSSVPVTVNPLPVVSFSGLESTYCSTDAPVTLTGSPVDGIFSGPGISGNSFDPAIAGTGTHTIIYNYTDPGTGCDNLTSQQVTVNVCNTTISLNIKLLLEGYYIGAGIMQQVLFNQGVSAQANETDSIEVELHDAVTFALLGSKRAALHTDGTATAIFTQAPGSYYIAVKHRNSIQTWSANPVDCTVSTPVYDFSSASNMAMGDNQALLQTGIWGLYTGDLNQDDYIDGNDFPLYDAESASGGLYDGTYTLTDMNGDGFVDGNDFPVFDINSSNGVSAVYP